MEGCQKSDPNQRALVLTNIASGIITILCALILLRIPSDSKNAFLFGLSKERLLMLAVFFVLFLLNVLCVICSKQLYDKFLSKTKSLNFLRVLTFISMIFVMMPEYRFGKAAAYYTRLKPFILWIFLTSLIYALYCQYNTDQFKAFRETVNNIAKNKSYILAFAVVLAAGIVFVELTGLGKTAERSLWNKNGIPLQSIQLVGVLIIYYCVHKLGVVSWLSRRKKLLNFLVIWVCSALIWSIAPLSDHFFAPGPYEPYAEYYPYSDSVSYDLPAQTALNGWEFNYGEVVLKPAVTFVSFLTHLVTGNDYNRSMYFQSALYAVLPAIIYLFGTAIGGTGCGYLSAVFSMLKEWNALNTHTVLTINSRLVMSEFLVQIVFALFCYGIFRWLKRDGGEYLYASLSGGALTVGIFCRYNMLAFIPAALVILLIAYRKELRALWKPLLFFIMTILLASAPMVYRSTKSSSNMFTEFSRTVRDVLIAQRFNGEAPKINDTNETTKETLVISDEKTSAQLNTEESSLTDKSDAILPESQIAAVEEKISELPETLEVDFNTGQITQENSNNNSNIDLPVFQSMINHGLHNFIASILTLPMELRFDNLEHLYTQEGDGLWKDNWQGDFCLRQWVMITVWFILGAVSVGILIRVHGIAGFSILYFWVVYGFSTGFSRSSGGRYIVPTNWVPMLLLAFLCALIFNKGKVIQDPVESVHQSHSLRWPVVSMVCFTLFFTSMVLFEYMMPARDTAAPEGDLVFIQNNLSDSVEIDWELVDKQVSEGTMNLTHGIVLYPRFYYFKTGEHVSYGSQAVKEYSRISFFGINNHSPKINQEYMLPHTELIKIFPQDSVFRALSCKSGNQYEDVLAVTVETPDGEVFSYVRDPLPEFSCPVPEPVCYGIENCY